jgi:hypothetical protein
VLLMGLALGLIGVFPKTVRAIVLLGVLGIGNTIVDVSAVTLMQRAVRDEVLGRVFGALESLLIATAALGALLAPLLIDLGDPQVLVIVGGLLVVVTALWAKLRRSTSACTSAAVIELLRANPIFGPCRRRRSSTWPRGSFRDRRSRRDDLPPGRPRRPLLPRRVGALRDLDRRREGATAGPARVRRDRAAARHPAHGYRDGRRGHEALSLWNGRLHRRSDRPRPSREAADAMIGSRSPRCRESRPRDVPLTDAELVARCRAGDERLGRAREPFLALRLRDRGAGFRLSEHDAEDVFQEVFARTYERLDACATTRP